MWIARACHETREANRTWFATLTLSPSAHYAMQSRGMQAAAARSIPTKELTVSEIEKLQWQETAREVTLFLKRVRKNSGARLRYLLVQERHKSGLPHYHLVLHEVGETPIRHAVLDAAWQLGHAKFKLVDVTQAAAFYVSKYLGKANEGRVRASLGYGRAAAHHRPSDSETQLSVMKPFHFPA